MTLAIDRPDRTTSIAYSPPDTSTRTLSPERWYAPVVNSECSLHQLSPYIGKLKSSIAADIVDTFSNPGEIIADPFCGAGTIALEAKLAGRRVFASDISPYAYALTDAKLKAPRNVDLAIQQVEALLDESEQSCAPDLRSVPKWVRTYFNPRTLKEVISFANVCQRHKHTFGLSCLLGILHHQRPGFLSYPSSHLVPYLRARNFPIDQFPELYGYRALRPRILSKVIRAYKRVPQCNEVMTSVVETSIDQVKLPYEIDAVITSPPYMNALDYGRDNRLRLWFLEPAAAAAIDDNTPSTISEFAHVMTLLATKVGSCLRKGGYCVLIIGDAVSRSAVGRTAQAATDAFLLGNTAFEIILNVTDVIPDVRRARRYCRGVKNENIIVFQKTR